MGYHGSRKGNMTKIEMAVVGLIAIIFGFCIYILALGFTDEEKYCDIAMYGSVQSLPAKCLKRVTQPTQPIIIERN